LGKSKAGKPAFKIEDCVLIIEQKKGLPTFKSLATL